MNGRVLKTLLAALLFAAAASPSALACATCYGASDSPLAQGMNWGILTLLVEREVARQEPQMDG
jgi:hypothetical protein